jgi:hypothetical protein
MRLVAAKAIERVQRHAEWRLADGGEGKVNLARQTRLDIADKAQRQVIVLGVNPARLRQAALHQREVVPQRAGNFETGEEPWHGAPPLGLRCTFRKTGAALSCLADAYANLSPGKPSVARRA